MAKTTFLGIDIGYDYLKLALVNKNTIKKAALVRMEENLIKDGRIVSVDALADFIRSAMKANDIRCSDAAVVISDENSYVRTVSVPQMTEEQLTYNIPFEFRDYITGELKDYIFDYAMISNGEKEPGADGFDEDIFEEEDSDSKRMVLLAAATTENYISELKLTMRKAGMKLMKAAPSVCAYRNLILDDLKISDDPEREYCIMDLGYNAVRVHIFKGERYVVSRTLEIGTNVLDRVVADMYNIDIHLAHTYFLKNFENCQESPECIEAFNNIALELQRVVNFYRFSNPDSKISDMWICGGGTMIKPLVSALRSIDLKMHKGKEFIKAEAISNRSVYLQAAGIAYMD